jgi:hypothetical protein
MDHVDHNIFHDVAFVQLLYINVFDTAKYPGTSWERIDYYDDKNHGHVRKLKTNPSFLNKSEEAKAGNNDWQSHPIPTYEKALKAVCRLDYGTNVRC